MINNKLGEAYLKNGIIMTLALTAFIMLSSCGLDMAYQPISESAESNTHETHPGLIDNSEEIYPPAEEPNPTQSNTEPGEVHTPPNDIDSTNQNSEEHPSTPTVDLAQLLAEAEISALHPIIYDGFLLGGFNGSEWMDSETLAGKLDGGVLCSLYSMDAHIGHGVGFVDASPQNGPYEEPAKVYTDVNEETYLAISCDWNCLPRLAVTQSNQNEEYVEIVRAVLSDNGLNNPEVVILQNYSVDLDGDGVDEVIIYAEYSKEEDDNPYQWRFTTQEGDYSLLLALMYTDGNAVPFAIIESIFTQTYPTDEGEHMMRLIFDVIGFYDLDGDGELEILVKVWGYEGIAYPVYKKTGNGIDLVGIRYMGPW